MKVELNRPVFDRDEYYESSSRMVRWIVLALVLITFPFDGTNGTLIRKLNSPSPETFAGFGASVYVSADITGDRRADVIVGAPNQNVNGLLGAGQAFVYNGVRGRLFSTLTSANPQSHAGFGKGLTTVVFPGSKLATPVVGAPYQTAVVDAVTHLQIGQVEIMQ